MTFYFILCIGMSLVGGQKQQSMAIDDDKQQSMGTKDCSSGVASMAVVINGGVKPQYAVAVAGG